MAIHFCRRKKQDSECREGKTFDQITATTDLSDLSIEEGRGERELLEDLRISARIDKSDNQVYNRLIEVLKFYPITKLSSDETRAEAAMTVLRELLKDERFELPSSSKIILYELLLIALRDGHISSIEWALLKEYQAWGKIEDFIFQDILKRVESINQEISQTIAIVLE